jgi:hypothetical protein
MMPRIGYALCLLGLATGCGDPGRAPDSVPTPPQRLEEAKVPPAQDTRERTLSVSKASDGETKSVIARSPDGMTRIEAGSSPKAPADLRRDKPSFYPVLRNFDTDDLFTKTVVYTPIATRLGVFACRKSKSPTGGIGIDYVLKKQLKDYGLDESKIIELCYENFFKTNIKIKALKQGEDLILNPSSDGGLVTAILGHSSTCENFAKMLKADDLAILIDGSEILLVTASGSSFEPTYYQIVKKSQHKSSALNLDPGVYHWTKKDGLTLVSDPEKDRSKEPAAEKPGKPS